MRMMPSDPKALRRVASLIQELIETRGVALCELPFARSVLRRAVTDGKIRLTTLVRIADALDADVVVHLRMRTPSAPPLRRTEE
jgi:hypothetical protein